MAWKDGAKVYFWEPANRGVPPMISCPHCGQVHNTTCPRIKITRYRKDGSIKSIEFHLPTPLTPPTPEEPSVSGVSPVVSPGVSPGVSPVVRPLSQREARILRMLAMGDTNKQIARKLQSAEATVKVHVKSIHRKLGFRNRTQVARWFATGGSVLLGPEPPLVIVGVTPILESPPTPQCAESPLNMSEA